MPDDEDASESSSSSSEGVSSDSEGLSSVGFSSSSSSEGVSSDSEGVSSQSEGISSSSSEGVSSNSEGVSSSSEGFSSQSDGVSSSSEGVSSSSSEGVSSNSEGLSSVGYSSSSSSSEGFSSQSEGVSSSSSEGISSSSSSSEGVSSSSSAGISSSSSGSSDCSLELILDKPVFVYDTSGYSPSIEIITGALLIHSRPIESDEPDPNKYGFTPEGVTITGRTEGGFLFDYIPRVSEWGTKFTIAAFEKEGRCDPASVEVIAAKIQLDSFAGVLVGTEPQDGLEVGYSILPEDVSVDAVISYNPTMTSTSETPDVALAEAEPNIVFRATMTSTASLRGEGSAGTGTVVLIAQAASVFADDVKVGSTITFKSRTCAAWADRPLSGIAVDFTLLNPHRVGISGIKRLENIDVIDRTQSLAAVITPRVFAANATIEPGPNLKSSEAQGNSSTGRVTFDLVGLPLNDSSQFHSYITLTLRLAAGTTFTQLLSKPNNVDVIIPTSICIPVLTERLLNKTATDKGSLVARALDEGTVPPVKIPKEHAGCMECEVLIDNLLLPCTVLDQAGQKCAELYGGSSILEEIPWEPGSKTGRIENTNVFLDGQSIYYDYISIQASWPPIYYNKKTEMAKILAYESEIPNPYPETLKARLPAEQLPILNVFVDGIAIPNPFTRTRALIGIPRKFIVKRNDPTNTDPCP